VVKESLGAEQSEPHWFIDLDWYEQNGRLFATLAQGCLCPRCRERLKAGEISEAELAANIRDCCSKLPGFITGEMAILAIMFRLFLANGNQPLTLAGLSEGLSEWLGGDTYRTSAEVLSRLLKDERYYGIRRVLT
jgi:hypothetical protein